MEYMRSKSWVYFVVVCFFFSCSNSDSVSNEPIEDDLNFIVQKHEPELRNSESNGEGIIFKMSNCEQENISFSRNIIFRNSLKNQNLNLRLGGAFYCEYLKGALITNISTHSDSLILRLRTRENRPSSDCMCYVFFDINLESIKHNPSYIKLNNREFYVDEIVKISKEDNVYINSVFNSISN